MKWNPKDQVTMFDMMPNSADSANMEEATTTQLYTIAHHEPCSPVDRVLALQELDKRSKQKHGASQARIKRKLNN